LTVRLIDLDSSNLNFPRTAGSKASGAFISTIKTIMKKKQPDSNESDAVTNFKQLLARLIAQDHLSRARHHRSSKPASSRHNKQHRPKA